MVTIAQRLCELRTEKNLSRPALSEALGLPRMTVEKFETGRLTPSAEQQTKIASFFGVSVPYLRGESGDRTRMILQERSMPPETPRIMCCHCSACASGGRRITRT